MKEKCIFNVGETGLRVVLNKHPNILALRSRPWFGLHMFHKPCNNRKCTIVVPTDAHKYIEISLYSCTQWPPTCFSQPCGHLQGDKIQRMDTLKCYQNESTSQPYMLAILNSCFPCWPPWLHYSVVYCAIYITTHSLGTYFLSLLFYLPISWLVII
jgi:hypothetical protein